MTCDVIGSPARGACQTVGLESKSAPLEMLDDDG